MREMPSPAERFAAAFTAVTTLGSVEEDRARIAQLLGRAPTDGYLIRSPSTLTPPLRSGSGDFRLGLVPPKIRWVANRRLPFSQNEGALWAGRGNGYQLTAGVRASYGRVSLIFAPQFSRHENAKFQTPVPPAPGRDPLSSPWYHGLFGNESADLPQRFGKGTFSRWDLGQSTLWIDAGKVAVGASTENQWWGPGIRNAIVMSNNAPGIPHLFLRSAAPIRTRIGTFQGKWMVGGLSESEYFDTIPANDLRSISAFAATFQPAGEPDLTLGFARAVYGPVDDAAAVPTRAFDVFTRSGRSPEQGDSVAEGEAADQILSLFGRWVFPNDGFEVYGEWSRVELPTSLRDFLTAPNHTQGYTLGLQWAKPLRETDIFRLQSELTYLEMSSTFRQRPVPWYYTSRDVPHGYTQQGRVIGAAIGPGSSSQWIAADYLGQRWGIGIFGGRIRWDNDVYYTYAGDGRFSKAHDVSVLRGIRAQYRFGWLTSARR